MVTKRTTAIRDKYFRWLARDSSCCKKNFVIECYSWYVSHITNSCIFKNLIWNEALTATFAANCSKYYIKSWLVRSCYCIVSYLLRNQSLKFKFSTDPPFQVFLWWILQQQEKIWLKRNRYFYLLASDPGLPKKNLHTKRKKTFIQKVFVLLKLSAFCFKISSFSFPGSCINFILHLLQLVSGIQSMVQFYFTRVRLEFLEGGG